MVKAASVINVNNLAVTISLNNKLIAKQLGL